MPARATAAEHELREEELLTDEADCSGSQLAALGLETRRALEASDLDRRFLVPDSVAEALEAAR